MRERTFAAALVVAATAALVGASGVSAVDAKGPPCGDIAMDSFYSLDHTVGVNLLTPVATCTNVTYTLVVNDSPPQTDPVSANGDGDAALGPEGDVVTLSTPVNGNDNEICIYSQTTIGGGGHVIDRSPDSGCVTLHPGETGGGSLPD